MNKSIRSNSYVNYNSSNNLFRIIRIIIFIFLMLIIFIPPYIHGLYFENHLLYFEIFVFVLFVLFCIYKLLKKDKSILRTPIDFVPLLFAGVYFVTLFSAISVRTSIGEWLKYVMYFTVYIMLSEITRELRMKVAIIWIIAISTFGICIIGIDAASGGYIVAILNKLLIKIGVSFQFSDLVFGNRIYSVIQYPDTLAAYLIAGFYIVTGLVLFHKNIWIKMSSCAISFITLLTILFTRSRGGLLLFPITLLVFIITVPKSKKMVSISYLVSLLLPTAFVYKAISGYISETSRSSLRVWFYITLGGFVCGAIFALLLKISERLKSFRIERKHYKIGAIAASIIIVIGVFVLSVPAHLVLGGDNVVASKERLISLSPGNYTLQYSVYGNENETTKSSYSINISDNNMKSIIYGGKLPIGIKEGEAGNIQKAEIDFTVPPDSKYITIGFTNNDLSKQVVFLDARIIKKETGLAVKKIVLNHKFYNDTITDKFKRLFNDLSVLYRFAFYKDALRMFADHWLLGTGGGGWSHLYASYQPFNYISNEVHSFPLQLLTDNGILGIVLILALLGVLLFYYKVFYNKRNMLSESDGMTLAVMIVSVFALLAHSVIDFDMSLPAYSLLFWCCLAIFNSKSEELIDKKDANDSIKSKKNSLANILIKLRVINAPVSIVVVIIAVIAFIPFTFNNGRNYYLKSYNELRDGNIVQSVDYMKKAVKSDPFRAGYKVDLVNIIMSDENLVQKNIDIIDSEISSAEKLGNFEYKIVVEIAKYYMGKGYVEKGLEYLERAVYLRPLSPESWQYKADANLQAALHFYRNGEPEKGIEYLNKVYLILSEVKEKNTRNINPFALTSKSYDIIEKAKYALDNINTGTQIDISKVVFYGLDFIDVDFNNIPDQWTITNTGDLKIVNDNNYIVASNQSGKKDIYLMSRNLVLAPSKTYSIKLVIDSDEELYSIPYSISGVSQKPEELMHISDNLYATYFSTGKDYIPSNSYLYLGINDTFKIKSIIISEE